MFRSAHTSHKDYLATKVAQAAFDCMCMQVLKHWQNWIYLRYLFVEEGTYSCPTCSMVQMHLFYFIQICIYIFKNIFDFIYLMPQ